MNTLYYRVKELEGCTIVSVNLPENSEVYEMVVTDLNVGHDKRYMAKIVVLSIQDGDGS